MNNVTLIGNLTRDPEIREVGETHVTRFSIAINKKVKARNGEQKDIVVFPEIEVWGKVAENCEKYLEKGSKVAIIGELAQDSWETKEGEKRTKIFVKAISVEFLSSKSESQKSPSEPKAQASEPVDDIGDFDDDDVPF